MSEAKENPIEAPKEQTPPKEEKPKRKSRAKTAKKVSVWAKSFNIKGIGRVNAGDVVTAVQKKYFEAQIKKNYDPKGVAPEPKIDAYITQV